MFRNVRKMSPILFFFSFEPEGHRKQNSFIDSKVSPVSQALLIISLHPFSYIIGAISYLIRWHPRPKGVEKLWRGVAHVVHFNKVVPFEHPPTLWTRRAEHCICHFRVDLRPALVVENGTRVQRSLCDRSSIVLPMRLQHLDLAVGRRVLSRVLPKVCP